VYQKRRGCHRARYRSAEDAVVDQAGGADEHRHRQHGAPVHARQLGEVVGLAQLEVVDAGEAGVDGAGRRASSCCCCAPARMGLVAETATTGEAADQQRSDEHTDTAASQQQPSCRVSTSELGGSQHRKETHDSGPDAPVITLSTAIRYAVGFGDARTAAISDDTAGTGTRAITVHDIMPYLGSSVGF
jgi:hypothetical protein